MQSKNVGFLLAAARWGSAEQCQRMQETTDRCPAHKTLHGKIKVRATLERALTPF